MGKKIFGLLQQLGKAVMLPVALLPAAGLLLAFGTMFQNPDFLAVAPAFGADWIQGVAQVMSQSGDIIFGNLALLFAVGVAVGLSKGDGVSGLAAIVGFLIMNVTIGVVVGITPEMAGANPAYASVLGIPSLQTGVFGGIIVGILASVLFKKFYKIELPSYLGFFAGKRFVPIVTAAASIVLGLIMTVIWPPIGNGLNAFSDFLNGGNQFITTFIYGIIERSLIPFGLHHIFYNPFWYQFGEYVDKAGTIIHGDQNIFFAQLKDGVSFTAGRFMAGKFPFMMFGLPAAALAIYQEAKPERKSVVKGLMISAALTSFLTGITEPIEFSFLFLAPALFGIHAIFAGLSFAIMNALNIKIGMTFSGGLIDFILFGIIPNRTKWWLVIPIGLCFSVIYYFGFRFAIRRFNLKTPGREEEETNRAEDFEGSDQAKGVLLALGGQGNLVVLDNCITRLRVQVKDISLVDKDKLKQLGAAGVLEIGNNIQAIYGAKAEVIKTQIEELIASGYRPSDEDKNIKLEEKVEETSTEETSNKVEVKNFIAPLEGTLVDLSEVADPVFAGKMMGEGFAIDPTKGEVVAPFDGEIATIFPTKHALGITSKDGVEVLIHIGMDTVELKGEGFEAFVSQGDTVKAGDTLVKFNLEEVKGKVPSIVTPIVFTNLSEGQIVEGKYGSKITLAEKNIVRIK